MMFSNDQAVAAVEEPPSGESLFDRIGGSDHALARARRLMFLGANGPVPGILGNTAIHLRDRSSDEKVPKVEDLAKIDLVV